MSGDPVVPLQLVTNPDERVVERLRELLDMAERGELRHLSFVAQMTGGNVWEGHVGHCGDRYALAGRHLAQAVNYARGF